MSPLLLALTCATVAAPETNAEQAARLNAEASALSQTGDFAGALAKYMEAIALEPDNHLYLFNAGTASWGVGRLDEAVDLLNRAVEAAASHKAFDRVGVYRSRITQIRYTFPAWANEARNAAVPHTPEDQAAHQQWYAAYQQANELLGAGKTAEAIEVAGQLVAASRQAFGNEHLSTFAALNVLGGALRAAGKPGEAAPVHQEALRGCKRILGPKHPDTLAYMHGLASAWQASGKLGMARPMLEKLVRLAKQGLGPTHAMTATYVADLGLLYKEAGQTKRAIAALRDSLKLTAAAYGPTHPVALGSRVTLAEILAEQGATKEAADHYLEAYRHGSRLFGPDSEMVFDWGEALLPLLREEQRYAAMTPILRTIVAKAADQIGEADPVTIRWMTDLAQTLERQGLHQEALTEFTRALERGRTAGVDAATMSTLLNNLALAQRRSGNLYAAEPLFEQAVALATRAHGPDHEETLQTRNNQALLMSDLGRYAEAQRAYEQILERRRQTLPADHPELLRSMHNLGMFLAKLGSLDEAHRLVHAALSGRERTLGLRHPETLYSLNGLGSIYLSAGDFERAQKTIEQAVALRVRVLGPGHADTLIARSNLAQLYKDQGRLNKAIEQLQEVHDRRLEALGPRHPETLDALNDIAIVYVEVDADAQAMGLFERALRGYRENLGAQHPQTLKVLNNLAQVHQKSGRFRRAKALLEQALEVSRGRSGKLDRDGAIYLGNLAALLDRMKRDAAALERYQEALTVKRALFGEMHPETLTTLSNLTTYFQHRERWPEADEHLRQAFRLTNRFLATVLWGADAETRQAYLHQVSGLDASFVSHWVARGGVQAAREVLAFAVTRKGMLLDIAAQVTAVSRARRDPAMQKTAAKLERLRADLAGRMMRGIGAGSETTVRALQVEIEQLEAQLGRVAGREARARPVVTVGAILEAVPRDAVLVDLIFYGQVRPTTSEFQGWAVVAVVVDPRQPEEERVRLVDLGLADEWIDDLAAVKENVIETGKPLRPRLRRLYDALWAPLASSIGDASRVLLVPDALLHLVPYAALVDSGGKHLAETVRLTLLSSSRDLVRQGRRRSGISGRAPVIVAGPAFGSRPPQQQTRAGLARAAFSPLPGATAEGYAIAQVMQAAELTPSLLTGAEANEAALSAMVSPRILHLATHGFFFADRGGLSGRRGSRGAVLGRLEPGSKRAGPVLVGSLGVLDALTRAGLALSGANVPTEPGQADGILTALEVLGLNLEGTELVVLSACDTGHGILTQGEGVYGLRRAFQEAGARAVISTLWPIDDEATRLFMTSFYNHYLHHRSAPAAVREVQQEFIADPKRKHPYYWAAFTAVDAAPSAR